MRNFLFVIELIVVIGIVSCSRSAQHRQILSDAERIAVACPDSALQILETIVPSDLKEDSLKALYAIVMATAHNAGDLSLASDSLTKFAFEYYRDKDFKRFIEAGNLYSLHCFWIGDGGRALSLLDSLIALNDVEKFSKVELLRSRIGIGGQMSDWHKNVSAIRHLMQLDTIEKFQSEYKWKRHGGLTLWGTQY